MPPCLSVHNSPPPCSAVCNDPSLFNCIQQTLQFLRLRVQTSPCQLFCFSKSGCHFLFPCSAAPVTSSPWWAPGSGTLLTPCQHLKTGLSFEGTCQLQSFPAASPLSPPHSSTPRAGKPCFASPATHMTGTNQLGGSHHAGKASDLTLSLWLTSPPRGRPEGLLWDPVCSYRFAQHRGRQKLGLLTVAIDCDGFISIPCDCKLFQFSDNVLCRKERISYADPL